MKIPAIPLDKQAHFLGGFAIAALLCPAAGPPAAFLASCTAGIAKELYDLTGRGAPDSYDLAATVFGGAVGVLASAALSYAG